MYTESTALAVEVPVSEPTEVAPVRLASVQEATPAPSARGARGTQDDPAEVTAAFLAYRESGDRQARNRLVEQHRSLAEALSRRYVNRGESIDDLEQVAFLGLVKAVERFDPTKGIPFAGFAVPTITGEIRRHFRDFTWAVKVHRAAKDLHVRLPAVSDRLTGELGRAPTPSELAEVLDCSVDAVLDALDASRAYRSTSTDTTEGSIAADHALLRSSAHRVPDPEERAMLADLLSELSDRDRTIVGLRYFEDLSQSEIAERVGVSQVHVSRILRQAIAQMRQSADPAEAV